MLALIGSAALAVSAAYAQSQTAQSIMVNLEYDSDTYEIEGTITWTFQRGTAANPGCAMNAYTNVWDGNSPVVTTGTGTDPGPVDAPAPDGIELQQHAQSERCTFFCGGSLTSKTYAQTVNQVRGWKRTFAYDITPVTTPVAARACWTSEETGDGAVDVAFEGFVCSESYLKQPTRSKYSFTAVHPDGSSRIADVYVQLQKQEGATWTTVAGPVLVPEADEVTGLLPVTAAAGDFDYFANAGSFGNAAVLQYLHRESGKPENSVGNILTGVDDDPYADSFAGNNNDLANGQVHLATFSGEWPGITETGTYRTLVTGTLKGNAGAAGLGFSVVSNQVVIGGCSCSQ